MAAPTLIEKYLDGSDTQPAGRAVVDAAIDWRRAGLVQGISESALQQLAASYYVELRSNDELTDQLFTDGLKWALAPIVSHVGLLMRVSPSPARSFQAFDYLVEQVDRRDSTAYQAKVPQFTWEFVLANVGPSELVSVGAVAYRRKELPLAQTAWRQASASADPNVAGSAWFNLAVLLEGQGNVHGAKDAYQRAFDTGHPKVEEIASKYLESLDKRIHTTEDTAQPGSQMRFPDNVALAMMGYLDQSGADRTRVRDLLTPLAFAEGHGLPEELWPALATALGTAVYTSQDVRWLLVDTPAADLVSTAELRGVRVYRLYHEALAENLQMTAHISNSEVQHWYVQVLLNTIPRLPNDLGLDWFQANPYIRVYLPRHAARASRLDDLLGDPGFLLAVDPAQLISALPAATTVAGARVADLYRQVAPQLQAQQVPQAAATLRRYAQQAGLNELTQRITAAGLDQL